jgi:RNA polymerase sigma-70 factor (ECF subfamily)
LRTVKPPDKTTEELAQEIKRGVNVEENFRQLFERRYAQIHRFFRRRGFSPEDSYELTQETFLSVYKGLKDFRQECSFDSWMFSIAANIFRSELERRKTQKRDALLISLDQVTASETDEIPPLAERIVDPKPDQLNRAIENEKSQQLHEAMQQLPKQMRLCTELRIVHDLPYKEIADLMGIEVNTVKAHLHQAKKHLDKKLRQYFDGIDI